MRGGGRRCEAAGPVLERVIAVTRLRHRENATPQQNTAKRWSYSPDECVGGSQRGRSSAGRERVGDEDRRHQKAISRGYWVGETQICR